MENIPIYFRDNFFSAGVTKIFNENKEELGSLDLKSAFKSSVDILDVEGNIIVKGRFKFFSNRWQITSDSNQLLGTLRQRFTFMKKRFEYDAHDRGLYRIESEAFSREYRVLNDQEEVIADFNRLNGFFEAPAFRLTNSSDKLSNKELVAIVMGVNMIQKRNQAAASSGS